MFSQALSQHIANSEKKQKHSNFAFGKKPKSTEPHTERQYVRVSLWSALSCLFFSSSFWMLFNESSVSVTPGLQSWMLLEF